MKITISVFLLVLSVLWCWVSMTTPVGISDPKEYLLTMMQIIMSFTSVNIWAAASLIIVKSNKAVKE